MQKLGIDRELDLTGEVCPYTFVWSKLAIEEMQSGQVLRVTVDNERSAGDVPRSLAGEGHRIIRVEQVGETQWRIVVQKR